MHKNLSLLLILTVGMIAPSISANAHGNYYNPDLEEAKAPAKDKTPDAEAAPPEEKEGPKTLTITSIEKCYAQLSREDALDIQKNFIKPYQECQRRLALKLKSPPQTKGAQDHPAESSRHYLQVQKPKADTTEQPEEKKRPVIQEKTVPLN
jgi:hypothetical protein